MDTLQQSSIQDVLQKPTMSIKETAGLLGVCENTVYEYLYQGIIPSRRLGKKWIISRKQINDWLNNAPAIPITQR